VRANKLQAKLQSRPTLQHLLQSQLIKGAWTQLKGAAASAGCGEAAWRLWGWYGGGCGACFGVLSGVQTLTQPFAQSGAAALGRSIALVCAAPRPLSPSLSKTLVSAPSPSAYPALQT
jgi:hypothetical protein